MRLILGPPPDAADVTPAEEGWHKLREPDPGDFLLIGAVIGMICSALITMGWKHIRPVQASVRVALDALDPLNINYRDWKLLLAGLAWFIGLVVVHELIHAVAFPRFGMTSATSVGFWPKWLIPYAAHTAAVRSYRMILVLLAPTLILSVAPLLLALVTGSTSRLFVLSSVVNAFLSGGDVMSSVVVAAQIPHDAWVRNKSWHSWWKAA